MSVLLVTDDADDEISPYEYLYQQINVYQSEFNCSSIISLTAIGPANLVYSKSCHRHYRRGQLCRLKSLLISMFSLLLLLNQIHWPIVFLSLSSLKMVSISASNEFSTYSIRSENDLQCSLVDRSSIKQICSQTCQAPKYPLTIDKDIHAETYSLPFCSMFVLNPISILNEKDEHTCQTYFEELINADDTARTASIQFTTYMQAIDSGSEKNPYASIDSDCQKAYQFWSCSVNIPFYHLSRRVLPCKTICDDVERVCPTLRPSDREPLFAGQPLFFCSGGIVANSDYAQRPYCFEKCHLANGSWKRHSVSSSSDNGSKSAIAQMATNPIVQNCFDIEYKPQTEINQSSTIDSQINQTLLSASSISLRSSSMLVAGFLSMILLDSSDAF